MKSATRAIAVGLCLSAAACTKPSTPAQPSAATPAANSSATSSVTVPRSLSPGVNAPIRNQDQPVTLVVGNAAITLGSAATYTFEVASDTAFATKVYSKSGVTEGANGQTSLTIDRIGAGADYYWRARAEGGGTI